MCCCLHRQRIDNRSCVGSLSDRAVVHADQLGVHKRDIRSNNREQLHQLEQPAGSAPLELREQLRLSADEQVRVDVREEHADERVRDVVHVRIVGLRRRSQAPADVLQSRSESQRATQQLPQQPVLQQQLSAHLPVRQLLRARQQQRPRLPHCRLGQLHTHMR